MIASIAIFECKPLQLEVRIARRREDVEGVISLELVDPAGDCLPVFEAGAHIKVQVAPGLVRHYSLYGAPEDRQCYCLGILREPDSRGGSARIHERFQEGALVSVSRLRNQFPLEEGAGHSLLVGGGIGITPILAMAWRLQALGASFELHYCVRNRARVAFLERLKLAPFADKLTLHIDDEGQRLGIPALLHGPEADWHVYVCGPGGFMDALIDAAR